MRERPTRVDRWGTDAVWWTCANCPDGTGERVESPSRADEARLRRDAWQHRCAHPEPLMGRVQLQMPVAGEVRVPVEARDHALRLSEFDASPRENPEISGLEGER